MHRLVEVVFILRQSLAGRRHGLFLFPLVVAASHKVVLRCTRILPSVFPEALHSLSVRRSHRVAEARLLATLEGRPVEVLRVLGEHLEAGEVGVLVANHLAVDKDVVLLVHELSESLHIERSAHAHKQF